jgi:uncharacterized protein YdeI (YjbR/CyaY-like superfamily)
MGILLEDAMKITKSFTPKNQAAWRKWLEKNHDREQEVWLVYLKPAGGKTNIDYESSVEEALCFGWIDSIIQNIDVTSHARKFTPRTNTIKWSETNKRRVRKLIAEGRMTPAGMEKVTFPIDSVEVAGPGSSRPVFEFSPEVIAAFQANPAAWAFFSQLPPSERRNVTGWIMSAKKDETRLHRLNEAMVVFAEGRHLGLK